MTTVSILRPGISMTVQDAGRKGMLRFGVSGAGAIDPEAWQMANVLVGNAPDAAALEFAAFGGTLRLQDDRMVAVCGAVNDLRIGGRKVEVWASHLARAGDDISIGALHQGVWGYVAIIGGIVTPPVLSARSTHLRTGLGGFKGRALQAGDCLPLGPPVDGMVARRLAGAWRPRGGPVNVVLGPQDEAFGRDAISTFLTAPFCVTQKRDRMAMVLEGPRIVAAGGHDIVSDGTLAGSVQVPGSGQPMVLLADRQTTGGYPKIATIAGADLLRLSQFTAGQVFRFRAISQDHAEDLLIARRAAFARALDETAATSTDAEMEHSKAQEPQ
jgi:5-oxoprolinase (ATP-hydrolysing) subunit C